MTVFSKPPQRTCNLPASLHPSDTSQIFPCFKITTWNINGLKIAPASWRTSILIKNIKRILKTSDFLLLQETHLTKHDLPHLNTHLPNHRIFHSGESTNTAGVITIASSKISDCFYLRPCPIDDESANGYLLPVYATHKSLPELHEPPTALILNCYLASGNPDLRLAQLSAAISVNPAVHNFAGGDWNFIDKVPDAIPYNPDYRKLSDAFKDTWDDFTQKFGLSEFHQPSHTRFDINGSSSARLDRIYGSFSPADSAVFTPICFVSHLPHSITENIFSLHHSPSDHTNTHPTDHLPVTVLFRRNMSDPTPNNQYPPELVYSETFRTAFLQLFSRYCSSVKFNNSPPHQIAMFKLAASQAMTATRKISAPQKIDSLVLAIRALRASARNDHKLAKDLISSNPSLAHMIAEDNVDTEKLKRFITDHTPPSVSESLDSDARVTCSCS
jgi:hypothetical protein